MKRCVFSIAIAIANLCSIVPSLSAQTYDVLYSFPTEQSGADETSTLIFDGVGNLYGTSFSGGTTYGHYCSLWGGCGTIFKITPAGKKSTVFDFGLYADDGQNPSAGVITDRNHNLYGTTSYGGLYGFGTVFKLDASGQETILHSFSGGADGKYALGGLLLDAEGNLYGTAQEGGNVADCEGYGCGTVYKIASDGTFAVLHTFTGPDGNGPSSALIADSEGNLYGTAEGGGTSTNCTGGCGVVFELGTTGVETVLHSFAGSPSDGIDPQGWLVRDSAGNLYGTTTYGGEHNLGSIYEIDANNQESVLHNFLTSPPNPGGQYPFDGLTADANGNLYGTASVGGTYGHGTVFRLGADGNFTVLHNFQGPPNDGMEPDGGVITDGHGNIYGATGVGGSGACPPPSGGIGCGVVYQLSF
jgi:uncharacterized repeat protein (TIGR03803 family)